MVLGTIPYFNMTRSKEGKEEEKRKLYSSFVMRHRMKKKENWTRKVWGKVGSEYRREKKKRNIWFDVWSRYWLVARFLFIGSARRRKKNK
jgi:hypothetical protein